MLPPKTIKFQNKSRFFFIPEYLKRIINYDQMDIEFTFWQMYYLCFDPSKVYKNSLMHQQIKNQWARDDPAFAAIMCYFIIISSFSFSIAFSAESFYNIARFIFLGVVIDFFAIGLAIATFAWWFTNKYMRNKELLSDQKVEWLFAFDIHCNSYFPLFLLLYVVQYLMIPFLIGQGFFPAFLSNTLYAFAFIYYFRLSLHGYSSLTFLDRTDIFLFPIAAILLIYLILITINFNMSIFAMNVRYGN
eukprot:TRINITY_DN12102_c0_g1_i1.p1 TRINITY_DN12102_c0_g1~~TRINITY_DN12102_c0_g1_i1.p1  ORF type:complete len:246 (+),score=23.18 TRINITY_DN12102_c0_g1_i1:35-772(+)